MIWVNPADGCLSLIPPRPVSGNFGSCQRWFLSLLNSRWQARQARLVLGLQAGQKGGYLILKALDFVQDEFFQVPLPLLNLLNWRFLFDSLVLLTLPAAVLAAGVSTPAELKQSHAI